MYFDDVKEIATIAGRRGTSVFVVPRNEEVEISGALVLKPEEKSVISMEQIRAMQEVVAKRQIGELFVVIRPAEAMTEVGANALLKTLEQPGDRVHFVLITDRPAQLLPTILSRATLYFLRGENALAAPVAGSEKIKKLARGMLTARGGEVVELAKTIAKARSGEMQKQALETVELAIEIAYKSYFATGNEKFLVVIPKLVRIYENISRGGNIKLQIVAGLA